LLLLVLQEAVFVDFVAMMGKWLLISASGARFQKPEGICFIEYKFLRVLLKLKLFFPSLLFSL
jgi:hypothetical protein